MVEAGTWSGGFYKTSAGETIYALPLVIVTSSMSPSHSWNDPFSSFSFLPISSMPEDEDNANIPGGGTDTSGTHGTDAPSGTHSGNGHSGHSSSTTGITDVIPKSAFKGHNEDGDCFKNCKQMLKAANCELNGIERVMVNANGRATSIVAGYLDGLNYIDSQLNMGHPVIVAVDYRNGNSLGEFSNRNDKACDHFVIIVGGNRTVGYHYFDRL